MTDNEIISTVKISPKDKILDVGGSMMQHGAIKIDTLVDLIRPEEAPYGATQLKAKKFIKLDITKNKLPFPDKSFDVVLCTHTLEDLPNPTFVIDELSRVGKRGLIVTPSMGQDMKFTHIDFTDWLTGARRVPGESHHKWFFVNQKGTLKIIPKNYGILYSSNFQVVDWMGKKEMVFLWKNKVNYSEVPGINIHDLIDEYKRFLQKNRENVKLGMAAVMVDSPFRVAKALLKLILKRGVGYKYRKNL